MGFDGDGFGSDLELLQEPFANLPCMPKRNVVAIVVCENMCGSIHYDHEITFTVDAFDR